ncbi:MAG: hypothetical protein ACR2PT_13445 [Endozoicomonas sp.]
MQGLVTKDAADIVLAILLRTICVIMLFNFRFFISALIISCSVFSVFGRADIIDVLRFFNRFEDNKVPLYIKIVPRGDETPVHKTHDSIYDIFCGTLCESIYSALSWLSGDETAPENYTLKLICHNQGRPDQVVERIYVCTKDRLLKAGWCPQEIDLDLWPGDFAHVACTAELKTEDSIYYFSEKQYERSYYGNFPLIFPTYHKRLEFDDPNTFIRLDLDETDDVRKKSEETEIDRGQ